jgi:DNA-binding NarL/FixJ family response regulator
LNPIRILITDDHIIVREGLRLVLETADGIEVVEKLLTEPNACASYQT